MIALPVVEDLDVLRDSSYDIKTPLAPSITMYNMDLEDSNSKPLKDTFSDIAITEDQLSFQIVREYETLTCTLKYFADDGSYEGTCQSDLAPLENESDEPLIIQMVPPKGC